MTTILRYILFFLLTPAFAIVAQVADAGQDDFRIVDIGFKTESAILDSVDGGICNYDFSGALLQQRSSLDGKSAEADDRGRCRETETLEAERSVFSFLAELVATNNADDALRLTTSGGYNPWKGDIRSVVAKSDTLMWRVHGDEAGQLGGWLSPTRPNSSLQAMRDLALPPQNSAEFLSPVLVPKGTRYQIGTAAEAFGQPGGGTQILLLDRVPAANFGTPQPIAPWLP